MEEFPVSEDHDYQQEDDRFNPNEFENESRPVCDICDYTFPSFAGFEYHILRDHMEYQPYRCVIDRCSKMFHTDAEIKHHISLDHKTDPETVGLCRITDIEKESEMLMYFQNVKMTEPSEEQSSSRYDCALNHIQKHSKFDKPRVGVPSSVRIDNVRVDATTITERRQPGGDNDYYVPNSSQANRYNPISVERNRPRYHYETIHLQGSLRRPHQ